MEDWTETIDANGDAPWREVTYEENSEENLLTVEFNVSALNEGLIPRFTDQDYGVYESEEHFESVFLEFIGVDEEFIKKEQPSILLTQDQHPTILSIDRSNGEIEVRDGLGSFAMDWLTNEYNQLIIDDEVISFRRDGGGEVVNSLSVQENESDNTSAGDEDIEESHVVVDDLSTLSTQGTTLAAGNWTAKFEIGRTVGTSYVALPTSFWWSDIFDFTRNGKRTKEVCSGLFGLWGCEVQRVVADKMSTENRFYRESFGPGPPLFTDKETKSNTDYLFMERSYIWNLTTPTIGGMCSDGEVCDDDDCDDDTLRRAHAFHVTCSFK